MPADKQCTGTKPTKSRCKTGIYQNDWYLLIESQSTATVEAKPAKPDE